MAVKSLTYTAVDAGGLPVNGAALTLQCLGSTGQPDVFYGTVHLLAPYTGLTGADGAALIANVPANADTADPFSYYRFTARGQAADGTGYLDSFVLVVPSVGSSPVDISTLKLPAPPPPGGPAPLHDQGSHQGDIWPDGTNQQAGTSTLTLTQRSAAGVSTPAAGNRTLFVRDSDTHLAAKKPDGTVADLEAGGGGGISGGTPALTFGTTNAAGVAATGVLTDATIAVFDAAVPGNSAPGDSAGAGTAGFAARRDHRHGREIFGLTAQNIGTTSAGSANAVAHWDHVHATGAGTPSTQALGDTAVVGTGPAAAMTDHKHAFPGTHDATYHTDVTRSIWLSAAHQAGNAADGGALAASGTGFPQKIAVWTLTDAATQGYIDDWLMPTDAKAATPITAIVYWAPVAADATPHTVRWTIDARVLAATDLIDATGTTTTWTGDSAARTARALVIETGQQILASTSANDLVRFDLRRIGADAADTYVGNVQVIGVRIDYTAVQ